jgi:hypothetical protein
MTDAPAEETTDVAAGFAAMMSQAAETAAGSEGDAPYGTTRDRVTGELRPKKAAGRPRRSPTVDELKQQREAAGDEQPPEGRQRDRAPDNKARKARGSSRKKAEDAPKTGPEWHEGQIARGVNKLYRKAGRLVRVGDQTIGQALIDITRKDEPDDVTVGEAWEDIARTNPRIRKFLLKCIAGGAWGQLLMAHAPVLLAILMKDAIRRHIPFGKLFEAFLASDTEEGGDGSSAADGTPFEGMQMPDMATLMEAAGQLVQQQMGAQGPNGSPRAARPPDLPPGFAERFAGFSPAAPPASNGE